MFGVLTAAEIDSLVKSQLIGRIGCHNEEMVYVVPISYAYDGEKIYCHTQEGMKVKMMRENPNVCFEVDILENMSSWKSVIAWGTFEEIIDAEQRAKALKVLLNRAYPFINIKKMQLGEHWPFIPADLNSIKGIVFAIKIKEKTGRYETNGLIIR
jgi:nitroimidazol reductase NimA-like FMN-containing flavoprotein (pyridoxamine 5'-phosphate oxidase superfamily)